MTNPLNIKCPHCGEAAALTPDNPSRPFCSARCRNADFIDWANEEHKIEGNPNFDDFMSGDLDQAE